MKKLLTGRLRADSRIGRGMVDLARNWMRFVLDWCERGRGLRPRWASQGLNFLTYACDPQNLATLTDEEFEDLRKLIDQCIDHAIGDKALPDELVPAALDGAAPPLNRGRSHSPIPVVARPYYRYTPLLHVRQFFPSLLICNISLLSCFPSDTCLQLSALGFF